MMSGQRVTQFIAACIRVFPDIPGLFAHGGEGFGGGAEDVFVCSEAGAEGFAAQALLHFGAYEGNGGGQARNERGIAWSSHDRKLA